MVIVISAVILYVFVSNFSEPYQTSTCWKVLGIAAVVAIVETIAATWVSGWWWGIGLGLLSTIVVAVALELWCKYGRAAAIRIAGIFLAVRVGLAATLFLFASHA